MQALVSLLPEPYYQAVEDIWCEMENKFGCQHAYIRPKPHFTWQYAEVYENGYAETLDRVCAWLAPIEVQTDIITQFSEQDTVLFLRIVPTPGLLAVHQTLWDALKAFCKKPVLFYQPGTWIPHITLSMDDSAWCALDEGRNFLKSKDLRWTFQVDSLTMLILNNENAWGMEKDFRFGLGETTVL
jgi:2'-5' RNA ligase